MTQNQSKNSSTRLSESEAIAYWDQKLKALDDRLRASGLTVEVTEASDGEELTATIPQARRSHPKRTGLREAYQAAVYQFDADGCAYTLRVGEQNIDVAMLFKKHGVIGATFITAHNPGSVQLGAVHNELADRALRQDLRSLAKVVFPGEGKDPGGLWPSEKSLLAAGIERSEAEMLARRYGQYAILWIDATGKVSLVELTDLDKASRYPLKVPPLGWVELGINWGYEWATLRLTPSQWLRILQGEDFGKTSRSGYDGETFTLSWGFSNGTHLDVSYGDGGCAYNGRLTGVSLTLVARE